MHLVGRQPVHVGEARPVRRTSVSGSGVNLVGQARHGWRFEDRPHAQLDVQRAVLTAAISRIAEIESPPISKNESSAPTRSAEHLGVDIGDHLLDRALRGPVAPRSDTPAPATHAGPALFTVNGNVHDDHRRGHHMYAGRRSASAARATPPPRRR